MLYLVWGILNIGLFLVFIAICSKATTLIREKMGLFASIIFAPGLLSFITANTGPSNTEPHSSQIKTWNFVSECSLGSKATFGITADLEKTGVSAFDSGIKYGTDKTGLGNMLLSAYFSATGFISGTNWEPVSIIINRTTYTSKFSHTVYNVFQCKLLGATVYSQFKKYAGIASIR